MTKQQPTGFCGWDIGGAHLKVARCDHTGQLDFVIELPCALWRGIEELDSLLDQLLGDLQCADDQHAITMTGELVDAFAHREQGVNAILDCVSRRLAEQQCYIFAGQQGWLSIQQARQDWQAVASMNWQASAMHAANMIENGLFMDIGSTTCDIVPFEDKQIQPRGFSDHQRQRDGGLVYSGAIRTPLMAITDKAPLNGDVVPLAAEWFASSGDIWCLLAQLDESQIQDDSADGQPWEKPDCRQRLARMLGTDADAASDIQWQQVAHWFAEQQLRSIMQGCLQVLTASQLETHSPLVGAGVGRFMVKACAERLGRPYIDFSQLCGDTDAASDHAPAAALALLASRQLS